jgi:hypothetical protein
MLQPTESSVFKCLKKLNKFTIAVMPFFCALASKPKITLPGLMPGPICIPVKMGGERKVKLMVLKGNYGE